MKVIGTIITLVCTLTLYAQSNSISGEYRRELGNEKHRIEYTLRLFEDGTFTFHSYTRIELPPQMIHLYGKGTWKVNGKVISFLTDKEKDIDEKYTLDFNNSRARFITKSPRDKSARILKTSLQFFESKILWIERLKIPKI